MKVLTRPVSELTGRCISLEILPMGREMSASDDQKTSGSILIVALIELEIKQLSLAFSRIRGMRERSTADARTTFGLTTISLI